MLPSPRHQSTNLQLDQLVLRLLQLVGGLLQFVQPSPEALQLMPQVAVGHVLVLRHGGTELWMRGLDFLNQSYLTRFWKANICVGSRGNDPSCPGLSSPLESRRNGWMKEGLIGGSSQWSLLRFFVDTRWFLSGENHHLQERREERPIVFSSVSQTHCRAKRVRDSARE